MFRRYSYVGPEDIRTHAKTQPPGTPIRTLSDLSRWLETKSADKTINGSWIVTFTLGEDEIIRLAPRRSEHVACASGGPVLSAGEIEIDEDFYILEISNLSTGFCPEPESWKAVAAALNRICVEHPGAFTHSVIFRLCPKCGERNIVKDSWYYCHLCDAELPAHWNFA